ncbi:MAG: glycosyltransferase [Desulfarculus sp.]|nr:glycosyltransferase [Desulfarculus sp.]
MIPERDAGHALRVCHVITTTERGGAETQLLRLVEALGPPQHRHQVICLRPEGELAGPLRAAGAQVTALNLRPSLGALVGGARALRRIVAQSDPHLVQTWLYHADLLGALAVWKRPLVWGLRNSDLDLSRHAWTTRAVVRACALLARRPRVIVANSQAGARLHQDLGYPARKMRIIPNGFDCDRHRPDPAERVRRRAELGLDHDALLVGMVARFDPAKDHAGFLDAARVLAGRLPRVRFLLIGKGVTADNPALAGCAAPPLAGRCHLLGPRDDVPAWLNALDLYLQSSRSEGMPNALGEAMASAVPCVATDAGDTRLLLGDCGLVTPPGQPYALAEAAAMILELPAALRAGLGAEARERIRRRFSLESMARAFAELYGELGGTTSRRSTSTAQTRSGQADQTSSSEC